MYRYIFFDLDGTLTRFEFGILEAAKRSLAHFGIETPAKPPGSESSGSSLR